MTTLALLFIDSKVRKETMLMNVDVASYGKETMLMFPQMFPCLPTRGNIVAETKFASREAKMFPTNFRNI
jgi:hypothetical protein